jgi:anti-sigma regulatory factor (Ser/Thr protein kinase)
MLRHEAAAGEGVEMGAMAVGVGHTNEDLALMAGATVIGSLTIPGRAQHVREARAFVAKALGDTDPLADVAVLLTSELVTNAVVHSDSRGAEGTVSLMLVEMPGGLRVEVADGGSDQNVPVVKSDVLVSEGHGLFLVQTLADQWGYVRDEVGTTVWFWLSRPSRLA